MLETTKRKGEVWKTSSRKGHLIIRLLSNVNVKKDDFFDVEILSGKANYMSVSNREYQEETGMGMEGSVISMRTTLTTWLKRYPQLEIKRKVKNET